MFSFVLVVIGSSPSIREGGWATECGLLPGASVAPTIETVFKVPSSLMASVFGSMLTVGNNPLIFYHEFVVIGRGHFF